MTMKQIVVWGCGGKLNEIVNLFPALLNHIDFLIDSTINDFMGISVRKPEILFKLRDINLVICTYSRKIEEEIRFRLITEFKIDQRNIISINKWIGEELLNHQDILLRPTSVRLEASTLCQLKCPTCPMRVENYGNLGAGYLKSLDFKHFIEQNEFIKDVELSNYGEVFLNPELEGIIQYAADRKIRLTMDNGVNLNYIDDEIAEKIVRSQTVRSITISIDGATQKIYEIYRRNGDIHHVLKNIQKINKIKEKYKLKYPQLYWQYILFKHNESEAEQAKKMAEDLNMQIIFKLDWSNNEWVPENRKKLEEVTKLKYFSRKEYGMLTGNQYLNNDICKGMIVQPQINYDGRLLGCCVVRKNDWGENVFDVGLISALNNKKYREAIICLLGEKKLLDSEAPCAKCRRVDCYKDENNVIL